MQNFYELTRAAVADFLDRASEGYVLLHHNDTDGICSGAIIASLLRSTKKPFKRMALEKPYPAVMKQILASSRGEEVILCDFASGMLPILGAMSNPLGAHILILDHHLIVGEPKRGVNILNCRQAGIDGSVDCSASALCFEFAKAANPSLENLAFLGVLGALGDGFTDKDGQLTGLNLSLCESALRSGAMKRDFRFTLGRKSFTHGDLIRRINALGSAAYFEGGPDVAIEALLGGWTDRAEKLAEQSQRVLDARIEAFLNEPKALRKEGEIDWFHLESRFQGLGVKSVGLVCEEMVRREAVNPDSYVIGFQAVENQIPGLGRVEIDQVKVSFRLGRNLSKAVSAGSKPGYTKVLPEVAATYPCFLDATHSHAAAVTIDPGGEEALVRSFREAIARAV